MIEEKRAQGRVSHLTPTTQNSPSTCPHSLISFCLLTSFPTSIIFYSLLLLLPPKLHSFFFPPLKNAHKFKWSKSDASTVTFLSIPTEYKYTSLSQVQADGKRIVLFHLDHLATKKINPLKLPGII